MAAALGAQIVLLIVAGIVLVPVIVLRSAGASVETTAWAGWSWALLSESSASDDILSTRL